MCLCLIAFRVSPGPDVLLAGNRDELHSRKSAPAAFWEDDSRILAGRDLEAGGTWLATRRDGRFAALTNFRDPSRNRSSARSRGEIVSGLIRSELGLRDWLERLEADVARYNDFNLIAGDRSELYYLSSVEGGLRELPPGVYGLSNHLLDTDWPKLRRARERFREILAGAARAGLDAVLREQLYSLLADRELAADECLPSTGVSLEWERRLSAIFVAGAEYGTRSSALLSISCPGEIRFSERSFGRAGEILGQRDFEFDCEPAASLTRDPSRTRAR